MNDVEQVRLVSADEVAREFSEEAQHSANVLRHFATFTNRAVRQRAVFELLQDRQWHCREHEGNRIAGRQYAGGGGIQGLQRGTGSRAGLVIEKKTEACTVCQRVTDWDRWTGEEKSANAPSSIPKKLVKRVLELYHNTDAVEQRERAVGELVIDHRFPMERWGGMEEKNDPQMPEEQIRRKFQLLKKDMAGNHNLLKSRACENCFRNGDRGTPMGIRFWYEGGPKWPDGVDIEGPGAEIGCHGCGWYDMEAWRRALNARLAEDVPPE